MHGYRNPIHEQRVAEIAREVGFTDISQSNLLAPLIEIVARARTTIVDAYLGPIVRSYMLKLSEQFGVAGGGRLQVMTSAGGLVDWQNMAGKDSILSGPAGGVVALRALARSSGLAQLIGVDMGGTSTDACRTSLDQSLEYESTKAGVRILTPTLPIETVASGGGSICWFDGVSLRVGPQSAGASPGPACYGRGGPLTITDLNVFVGRIPVTQFPFPIDTAAITHRLEQLHDEVEKAGHHFASLQALADGLRSIANQQMAEAVRTITISQGADPRQHALVGFGGAAGQHICEIADLLGMDRILDTPEAGLLSALGMGLASERLDRALPIYQTIDQIDLPALRQQSLDQARSLTETWVTGNVQRESIDVQIAMEMRYTGTDAAFPIVWQSGEYASLLRGDTDAIETTAPVTHEHDRHLLQVAFHAEHRKRFGYARPNRTIEVVSLRIEAVRRSQTELEQLTWTDREHCQVLKAEGSGRLWSDDRWCEAAYVKRSELQAGVLVRGPAVVLSEGSTLLISEGWTARAAQSQTLLIERDARQVATHEKTVSISNESDPVAEAVFAQRLAAIATQMGLVLQQTALSVNVKQRRDFSCAVFDRQGRMLASAPHVPVHLGAMGTTVRAIREAFPDLAPGDVAITNDPYCGGSHLPDVTVISGVFASNETEPRFYVANRAHHADIGGMAPGSMCITATRLADEGAIIEPLRLTAEECAELEPVTRVLTSAQWPPRKLDENLADLRAQMAANARGIELIEELADRFTWTRAEQLGQAVLNVAAKRVQQFVTNLPPLKRSFADRLDDGTPICVSISVEGSRLIIDFEGTGPISKTNFNANPSIVTAAIIYVLRCLIADDLPLNEGMMSVVDLRIPESVLKPTVSSPHGDSPAVAAGNVETSQRVVDVLLGAFEAAAASQGTMNNLLFGNQRFGFYETICGGSGATKDCDGASGVHTHMTNTRLTDPEVLEARYPARLLRFGLRRGSGGLDCIVVVMESCA